MSLVLLERPRPHVALLRINRPEARNALSLPVREMLAELVSELAADTDVRAIVLTGDEKAFAAGADLVELSKRSVSDPAFAKAHVAWKALKSCPKPLIAAVNGFALGGGCELMLHCDIIIAGRSARLGQPEVKVGIMPGAGGTQRILRAAGKYRANRWLLTGDMIDAATAYGIGIVSEVVEDDRVVAHALDLADKIAALPPLAIAATKEVVELGADAPLAAALALEQKTFQLLFATEDRTEGMNAFLEKRRPEFKGR